MTLTELQKLKGKLPKPAPVPFFPPMEKCSPELQAARTRAGEIEARKVAIRTRLDQIIVIRSDDSRFGNPDHDEQALCDELDALHREQKKLDREIDKLRPVLTVGLCDGLADCVGETVGPGYYKQFGNV